MFGPGVAEDASPRGASMNGGGTLGMAVVADDEARVGIEVTVDAIMEASVAGATQLCIFALSVVASVATDMAD
ncbi:hypothetical protein GN244_ATG14982 [Phytophthora infestans]|uniref:Uncharacterized protein n=1 Tax=Phytophthora infestans TaxID=4787 RepID=A0A833SGA1_PHYIN|nr:hypothetical protein GN244_ATG14982 [Phytophthora infestans]